MAQIAAPVAEITIAGNLLDMFRALVPANDLEHPPRGQRADAADRRDDGRRCLTTVARIAAEAGRIAAARCGTDYKTLGEGARAIRSATSISRSTPSCASGWPRSIRRPAGCPRRRSTTPTGSSGGGSGWSIRSTAPAIICASRPGWCVSVALVEDRVPVLGVLAAPARGELWTAERGRGSWRNGEPLRVSPRAELAGARVPADQLPKVDRDLVAGRQAQFDRAAHRHGRGRRGRSASRPCAGASNGTSPPPP